MSRFKLSRCHQGLGYVPRGIFSCSQVTTIRCSAVAAAAVSCCFKALIQALAAWSRMGLPELSPFLMLNVLTAKGSFAGGGVPNTEPQRLLAVADGPDEQPDTPIPKVPIRAIPASTRPTKPPLAMVTS